MLPLPTGQTSKPLWPAERFLVVIPKKDGYAWLCGCGQRCCWSGASSVTLLARPRGIDGLSDVIAHICSALRSHEIHAHACPRAIRDTFLFSSLIPPISIDFKGRCQKWFNTTLPGIHRGIEIRPQGGVEVEEGGLVRRWLLGLNTRRRVCWTALGVAARELLKDLITVILLKLLGTILMSTNNKLNFPRLRSDNI